MFKIYKYIIKSIQIQQKKEYNVHVQIIQSILIIQYLVFEYITINMKKASSKQKTFNKKQYQTVQNSDGQQDLQIRQSPQPILSTNRIQKSKSTKQTEFKTLTRNKSSTQYISVHNLLSTKREIIQSQQKHFEILINKLKNNWTKISKQELNNNYIEVLNEDNTLEAKLKIKINFLIVLKQILMLKSKIRDAQFNENLMRSQQKSHPENANKQIIIQLLIKKLKKKLFIECLKFNLKLKQLNNVHEYQQNNNQLLNTALNKFIQIINNLTIKRLNQFFIKIKTQNQIELLFSQGNSAKQENQKILEISLSPTKFQKYNSQQHQKQQITSSIKETNFLIRSLEQELSLYEAKFQQSSVKSKKIYFLRWKIMFLRKYQEKLTGQHYQFNNLKKCFGRIREYRQENFIKIEEENQEGNVNVNENQQIKQLDIQINKLEHESGEELNKKNLRNEKSNLKKKLRQYQITDFFKKLKQYRDTVKIYEMCRQIYNKKLQKKSFLNWKLSINQNHKQNYQQLWKQTIANKKFDKLQKIQQQIQEYSFKREQKPQQVSQLQQSSHFSPNSKQKISNVSADLFYKYNLKVKVYFFLKNTFTYTKAVGILKKTILKNTLNKIMKHKQQIDKLDNKIMRFQSKRMKLLLFKYFSKLKQSIQSSPQNIDKLRYYLKSKDYDTKIQIFSILKLEYKRYLIKSKKAQKMNQFFIKRKIFDQLIENMIENRKLKISKQKLISFLYKKNSIHFFKKFVKFSLKAINKNKMLKSVQFKSKYKQTNLKYIIFQQWKKYITRKRNFKIILMRYRKLKEKELKKNIFRCLLKQVYQNSIRSSNFKINHNQSRSYSQKSYQSQYNSLKESIQSVHSKEHRYWLEKYYQNLCSFIK